MSAIVIMNDSKAGRAFQWNNFNVNRLYAEVLQHNKYLTGKKVA